MNEIQRYTAYELVDIENRTVLHIPAPGLEVVKMADIPDYVLHPAHDGHVEPPAECPRCKQAEATLATNETILEGIAEALDGLPISGDKVHPAARKYMTFTDQIKALRDALAAQTAQVGRMRAAQIEYAWLLEKFVSGNPTAVYVCIVDGCCWGASPDNDKALRFGRETDACRFLSIMKERDSWFQEHGMKFKPVQHAWDNQALAAEPDGGGRAG